MAVIERDVVNQSRDENGNQTIDFPLARLGWIETDAEVKNAPTGDDYVALVDSADVDQMKKAPLSAMRVALGAAPTSHTHDDRYYTEEEVNAKLNGKSNTGHKHSKIEINDFPTSMPASDVHTWAKAATKPGYTASEVGAVPQTRKVNGKALSADITLSAADVGAATKSDVNTAINAAIGAVIGGSY